MLQKLENAYLAILRFVVLGVAGLLLIGVVIQLTGAAKLLQKAPDPIKIEPAVAPKDVISDITRKPSESTKGGTESSARANGANPHDKYYGRMVDAIVRYGKSFGRTVVDRESLINVFKEDSRIKEYASGEHAEKYLEGLAKTFEIASSDQTVMKAAPASNPFSIFDDFIQGYTNKFKQQLDEANEKNANAMTTYQMEKANGLQSLYYAGGAFGAFLLIVFLSIFIRIERNLRNLERLPVEAKPTGTPASKVKPADLAENVTQ
ncbi:hypothetical protein [Chromobacterium haemolyticum]|uniref:hypothetical protein n=1 Tax=Chromobacterium TaxID=535 RepID=UPI0040570505